MKEVFGPVKSVPVIMDLCFEKLNKAKDLLRDPLITRQHSEESINDSILGKAHYSQHFANDSDLIRSHFSLTKTIIF